MRASLQIFLAFFVAGLATSVGRADTAAQPVAETSLIDVSSLAGLPWIQGEAPAAWEPGKVYMLDLWSITCPPCIRGIPHMNDLHRRYGPKGLRVVGVNVQDKDRAKVEAFVRLQGENMSYPIVFGGADGEFDKKLLASGNGIPHVFIVKDGRQLINEHPVVFTDEVIKALLAGGEAEARAMSRLREAKDAYHRYHEAYLASNTQLMAERLAELETAHPDYHKTYSAREELFLARLDELVRDRRRSEIEPLLRSQPKGGMRAQMLATSISRLMRDHPSVNFDSTWRVIAELMEEDLAQDPGASAHFFFHLKLAEVRARAGQWSEALAASRSAEARFLAKPDPLISPALFTRYRAALEAKHIPTDDELNSWVRARPPE